jgi:hypothetical protein
LFLARGIVLREVVTYFLEMKCGSVMRVEPLPPQDSRSILSAI